MNYFCNLNSKTFFRFVREDAELLSSYRPLSLHVNYHPEKVRARALSSHPAVPRAPVPSLCPAR